jgi:hypothetical protein
MSTEFADQQVNLYQPILGANRRAFSARSIVVAWCAFSLCLVGLGLHNLWRVKRIEASVDQVERQEAANVMMLALAKQATRPRVSLETLDADAKALTTDIETRQHALAILGTGGFDPARGFAARLEALSRRHLDGIWLTALVLGSGEGRLALRGATTDSHLVPTYLAGLSADEALAGVRFDRLDMRRGLPSEAPARVVFELGGPGIAIAAPTVTTAPRGNGGTPSAEPASTTAPGSPPAPASSAAPVAAALAALGTGGRP